MVSDGDSVDGEVAIDQALLDDLLLRVDDLTELKVTLQVVRLAAQHRSAGIRQDTVLAPEVVRAVVSAHHAEPGPDRLRRGLDRALADGLLLRLSCVTEAGTEVYLFPASRRNRLLVEQLRTGDDRAATNLGLPAGREVIMYRPNVFALYEQYVGPLTPLVAEQLRDAESSYPRVWLEDAILSAAEYNKRNWRYIQSILTEWERTGAPHGTSGRNSSAGTNSPSH